VAADMVRGFNGVITKLTSGDRKNDRPH
jgi:hypothetical protein